MPVTVAVFVLSRRFIFSVPSRPIHQRPSVPLSTTRKLPRTPLTFGEPERRKTRNENERKQQRKTLEAQTITNNNDTRSRSERKAEKKKKTEKINNENSLRIISENKNQRKILPRGSSRSEKIPRTHESTPGQPTLTSISRHETDIEHVILCK